MADDTIMRFFTAMEDTRRSIAISIDKVADKIEDVRANMVTPRDLEDLRQRILKAEVLLDELRKVVVSRSEIEEKFNHLHTKFDVIVEKQSNRISALETSEGRGPQWLWPTIIATGSGIATAFLSNVISHGK